MYRRESMYIHWMIEHELHTNSDSCLCWPAAKHYQRQTAGMQTVPSRNVGLHKLWHTAVRHLVSDQLAYSSINCNSYVYIQPMSLSRLPLNSCHSWHGNEPLTRATSCGVLVYLCMTWLDCTAGPRTSPGCCGVLSFGTSPSTPSGCTLSSPSLPLESLFAVTPWKNTTSHYSHSMLTQHQFSMSVIL